MRAVHLVSAITLSLAGSSLAAQTPALEAAAAAMGGKARILGIRTLVLEGTGDWPNYGQNHTPAAATSFEITAFRRVYDFPNRRWFFDQTRQAKFVTANMAPQRVRFGLDGDVAYNVSPAGAMTRGSALLAASRAYDLMFHPVGFVQAAQAASAGVDERPAANNVRIVRINAAGGTYTMRVDTRTNLPTRIERNHYEPMLGDVTAFVDLSDWKDASAGGAKLPMRMTMSLEKGGVVQDYRVTSAAVNGTIENIAATDSVRALAPQAPPAPPTIVVDTLAPGVWRIAGQTHHTIAIEQSNRVVLVEAPQNDARSLAAIAKAREIAPAGKPVEIVINTHHHFDHSGGFRTAVSQGLQVITHEGNKDFYERTVYPGVHRSQPDALAQNPKPLRLLTVGDRHTMRDNLRTIEIHHIAGNPHNGNMLVVYLPAEKILIQADLYNPPAANAPANAPPPVFPFVANLVESITRKNLQVERVVGIHGAPVPWAQVQAAAAAARTP